MTHLKYVIFAPANFGPNQHQSDGFRTSHILVSITELAEYFILIAHVKYSSLFLTLETSIF